MTTRKGVLCAVGVLLALGIAVGIGVALGLHFMPGAIYQIQVYIICGPINGVQSLQSLQSGWVSQDVYLLWNFSQSQRYLRIQLCSVLNISHNKPGGTVQKSTVYLGSEHLGLSFLYIREPPSVKKYNICWVFVSFCHVLYFRICVFVVHCCAPSLCW